MNVVKDKVVAFLNTTLKEHCTNIVNDQQKEQNSDTEEAGLSSSPTPIPAANIETQYKYQSFSVAQIKG